MSGLRLSDGTYFFGRPGVGIQMANPDADDLGQPAPGFVIDLLDRDGARRRLLAWATEMLEMRRGCLADGPRPVCPVEVVGQRLEPELEQLAQALPEGVEVMRWQESLAVPLYIGGERTSRWVIYLVAP
jgi:hypothetical protein